MATRCNIIIKRENEPMYQLYHHYDGYTDGVGNELLDMLQTKSLKNTQGVIDYILQDDGYEYEGVNGKDCKLHGDIEYLYVIDLANSMLYAYAIDLWGDGIAEDTEIISGNACIIRKYTPIPIGTDERFDS